MSKKVKIELDYDIGDPVFLKTDPEGHLRMVVEIKLVPGGVAIYTVAFGSEEASDHYAIELTDTKPVE